MKMKKGFQLDRHFFNSLATIALLIIAMISALLYVFNFLLENQTESRKDYLLGQSQITGNVVESQVASLERDLLFFANLIEYADPLQMAVDLNLERLLSHHSKYMTSVTLFTQGRAREFTHAAEGGITDTVFTQSPPDDLLYKGELEIRHFPEDEQLALITRNALYVFDLKLVAFLEQVSGLFVDERKGFSVFFSPGKNGNDELNVKTSIDGHISLHPETFREVDDLRESGLADVFMGKVITDEGEEDVFLAFYPIKIFNGAYGNAIGVTQSKVTQAVINGFLIIGGGIIIFTALILFVNLRYIKKLGRSREKMDRNRKDLEELVNQQKLLFEYSTDFTFRHDLKFSYSYVSENVLKVLGYTPEEFADSQYRRYTENPINKSKDESFKRILEGISESETYYVEIRNRSDENVILEVKEKPYFDSAGKFAGVIGIAKDVTDRFMSDQKFKMLFEYSSDPHLIYTQNGGILDCNEAALEVLGAESKEQLYSKLPYEFSPEVQPDNRSSKYKGQEVFQLALEKGKYVFDWTHRKLSGEDFPVEVTLTTVILNDEKVILAVWHDLTERKRIERVLIEGRQRAESLARSKQQFLSGMSHEIRTPLNAVVSYTDFLLDENPRPDQKEKLKALKFSADNLLNLVQDILDHSLVESGKINFSSEPFSVRNIMERVAEMMRLKADKNNVEVIVEVDEKIPREVLGDGMRLNQILINLAGNAVKFTEKGSVTLGAELFGQNDTHNEIRIKVKDTGIGIPKDKHELIFNAFEQADMKILNKYGGTGLGLAITKKLIELQGGSIGVKSETEKGSVFTVEMSFKRANTKIERDENSHQKSLPTINDLTGASVLIVEDNPINQKIAERFLKSRGANVVLADNGKEALDKLSSKNFDFVLMDIQMPEMDGYETTKAIRKIDDEYYRNLPIICLTADAFSEVRDRVMEAGMTDYVTKPIDKDKFFKVISKYYKPKTHSG